jgi:hypothetical protein
MREVGEHVFERANLPRYMVATCFRVSTGRGTTQHTSASSQCASSPCAWALANESRGLRKAEAVAAFTAETVVRWLRFRCISRGRNLSSKPNDQSYLVRACSRAANREAPASAQIMLISRAPGGRPVAWKWERGTRTAP